MIGSLPDNLRNAYLKYKTDKEYGEFVRTSFFALIVRLTGVITGFSVTLITTRHFGADAYGVVSICLAILSFSSVFSKLGLDVALMKYIPGFASKKDYPAIKEVYLEALKFIIPGSIIISVILYVFTPWLAENVFHKPYLTDLLHLNAWFTLPLVLLLLNSECARALKRIRTYTFLQTVSVSLFATILLVCAMIIPGNINTPAYIQFISITLSGILSTILWFKYSKFTKTKAATELSTKHLVTTSSSMFTTTLMQLTMSWAATLILAAFVSETQVGIYNALVRISVFTNITILAINSLAMPRFSETFAKKDFAMMRTYSGQATRLIFLTSLPLFVLLFFYPHWLLSIFGKEFPGNETELYILLAGQFIVCFSGLSSQILNMAGRQHILRNIAIVAAIVNVGMCFALIPTMGIRGACIAQLAGTFTWNFLSIFSVKRHFGFFTFYR
jgi:O-antigen/teichoic acid export membrane protein